MLNQLGDKASVGRDREPVVVFDAFGKSGPG
jgi:hypothetical protein